MCPVLTLMKRYCKSFEQIYPFNLNFYKHIKKYNFLNIICYNVPMNIINKLNLKIDIYQFKFFGLGDYATSLDVQEILDNIEIIKTYFSDKDGSITMYDDFIDFLYLKKYMEFDTIKDSINESFVTKFEDAINIIKLNFEKYKKSQLIAFLKENGIELIKTSKPNILYNVFDLVCEYNSAYKDILLYISKEKLYLIVNNFEDIKKIIIKYPDLCHEILSDKHFNEVKTYLLKGYFKVLKFFLNKKEYMTEANAIIKLISNYAIDIYKNINDDNALQTEITYKEILEFLKSINHNDYLLLEQNLPIIERYLNEYLEKNGKKFSFKLPLKQIFDMLKNEKISLQEKLLFLTHTREKNKIISIFTSIGQNSKISITEQLCSTSIPHDEYFTVTKQEVLNVADNVYLRCLQYFINKEKINDFISLLFSLSLSICNHYHIDYEELEVETDFNILLNMFMDLFSAYESNNDFLVKGLNYSISMFTMAIIEKLLRNLYKEMNTDTFIKNDWSSLGNLLNENNKIIVDLLGVDNVKVFSFYLIKYNNKFGFNYRNNFAHYKNIKTDDMNFTVVLKTTQILLCIINELIVRI